METEIVHVAKKARKNAKTKVVDTPRMDEPAPKKAPTEKQLAAREKQRVAREEKKKAIEQEKLKELYAQSEELKRLEKEAKEKEAEEAAKEFAKAEKKRLAAEKRKAAKLAKAKDIVASSSTVDMPQPDAKDEPFSKASAGIDEKYVAVADPGPVKRTKPNPWGMESVGISRVPANEPVTMMRKPNVGGRPQVINRIR